MSETSDRNAAADYTPRRPLKTAHVIKLAGWLSAQWERLYREEKNADDIAAAASQALKFHVTRSNLKNVANGLPEVKIFQRHSGSSGNLRISRMEAKLERAEYQLAELDKRLAESTDRRIDDLEANAREGEKGITRMCDRIRMLEERVKSLEEAATTPARGSLRLGT